ncbi:phosphatidylinositol-specific phospholipase C1-like protein [Chitinophaga tropicalis]|uniref:Calcium-dependent phosphoinositide phospholipase C n=1 Tax=Chitinophaga tropicalis TaxID=2683588 RepID=A0A7K1UDM5_9BACT|nr:phosphatidylinositol-specific phospholipase C1-like protein [Chitinophaga tropicalis]MVT12433.1 hypothetical protein [Chitinophaga tropicalis]
MKILMAALLLTTVAFGAGPGPEDNTPINRIQVIGSHNSYKQAIDPALLDMLKKRNPQAAESLEYCHIGLSEQLSLGLRGLEIDVYADSKGGKYAHPHGLELEGKNQEAPYGANGVMTEPGFKVFHIPDLDFRSHCLTFKQGLEELKQWSDQHKDHSPIFITMNAKDEAIKDTGFTVPEKFTAATFDSLDKVITTVLGREKIITPDDIRGKYPTLENAVLTNGWPALKVSRGKFIFILDEKEEKTAMYCKGHLSLKGRALFVNVPAGNPEAAFMIINDPVKDQEKIREMVQKGYMVRTRADADTREARANDKSHFDAACQSGAQIITTDYYQKSTFFKSDYVISFMDGGYVRLSER